MGVMEKIKVRRVVAMRREESRFFFVIYYILMRAPAAVIPRPAGDRGRNGPNSKEQGHELSLGDSQGQACQTEE